MGNRIVKGLKFTSTESVEYEEITTIIALNRHIACHLFKKKGILKKPNKLLFFIHGVGGNSHIWQKQVDYFTNMDYEVLLIDLFGHGSSTKSESFEDYEFSKLSFDCLTIFDNWRLDSGQNYLVGHSYGCSMATYIAYNRQNLIEKMTLISGGGALPLGDPELTFVLPDCCIRCLHPIILSMFRSQAHYGGSSSSHEKNISINVESLIIKAMLVGQVWDQGGFFYHSQIFVPTILIHGKRDRFVTLDEETDMKNTLPKCKLHVIRKTGHMSMLQAATEVNALMFDHFTKDWISESPNQLPNGDQATGSSSMNHLSITDKSQNEIDNCKIKISPTSPLQRKTLPSGLLIRRKSTRLSAQRANSLRASFSVLENNVSQEITVQETISEEAVNIPEFS